MKIRRWFLALVTGALVAAALPALATSLGTDRPTALNGELIAELADAAADAELTVFVHANTIEDARDAVATAGLRTVEEWRKVAIIVATGTPQLIRALDDDPRVTYVEPNSDVEFYLDTAHVATRAEEARQPETGLLDAAGLPFDGSGVNIAINDTGIDGAHPMFADETGASNVVKNLRYACAGGVCDQWVDVADSDLANGHGTHVAGISAGLEKTTANGRLVRGAAPGASLVGLGSGAGLQVVGTASALNWVLENHADPCGDGACAPIKVVNNSWGGMGKFDPEAAVSKLSTALVNEGVVVVFAAGNGDDTNDGGDGSDDRVNRWSKNPTPGVISVANYDDAGTGTRDGALNSSSSRGLKTDPATYPDVAAPGTMILSACTYKLPICRTSGDVSDPYYAEISGTSMAAPYVAGVAALLLEADPTLTPATIEDILEDSAYKFGDAGDFVSDPANSDDTTSFDRGHGLVDVVAALGATLDRAVPEGASCAAGGTFVDAQGDATDVAVPTGLPSTFSEDALDILAAAVSTEDSGNLTFTVAVSDLGELPPTAAGGEFFRFYFNWGGAPYMLAMERVGGVAELVLKFSLQTDALVREDVAASLVGEFDPAKDTVTVTVPADVFNKWKAELPYITTGDQLTGLEVMGQRRVGPSTLTADIAAGPCPYTVGS